jgi:hypothetical protein
VFNNPLTYVLNIKTQAKQEGVLLSNKELKKGNFIKANSLEKEMMLTTILTDVPSKLWLFCQEIDNSVEGVVIRPKGFISSHLIINFVSKEFEIEVHGGKKKYSLFSTSPI